MGKVATRTIDLGGIADGLRGTIRHVEHGTVGSTEDDLSLSVLVPVVGIDVHLHTRHGVQVRTAVNPPKAGTVHLQCLDMVVMSGILSAIIRPATTFQEYFLHAITVQVGYAYIVRLINRGNIVALLVNNRLELDVEIIISPDVHALALRLFHTSYNRSHGIGTVAISVLVYEVGNSQWLVVHFSSVTIKIIAYIVILLAEDSPGAKDTVGCFHRHESSVNFVHHSLCLTTQR